MTPGWLLPPACALARTIAAAHRRHTGRDLVPLVADGLALAQALYAAPMVVLAHDGAADPCFIYANRTAQDLWGYPWQDFIGMPSRLSAPPDQRTLRAGLLATGRADGVVIARDLVRVTRDGRRFVIAEVVLWNLDQDGERGQAATYDRWHFVPADAST